MNITTVQWNIGGGKIRTDESTDSDRIDSYATDGLDSIITVLRELQPAIVTLQEVHKNDQFSQVAEIAKQLGMYYTEDYYADSHIEAGQQLGHAILSRFPLSNSAFTYFTNPKFQIEWEDGSIATSHDKGLTSCLVTIDDTQVAVATTHLLPFRRFRVPVDSPQAQAVLRDVQQKLDNGHTPLLLQGDFNLNEPSLANYFDLLIKNGAQEIVQHQPTTPNGHFFDHIFYRGLQLVDSHVIDKDIRSDHFPIVSTFTL